MVENDVNIQWRPVDLEVVLVVRAILLCKSERYGRTIGMVIIYFRLIGI